MTTVVMAYFNRQYQLDKTLRSIAKSAYKDFNVIIVDDGSSDKPIVPELSYEVEVIRLEDKTWTNCSVVYNYGFNHALKKNPDIIIIQSAECYHVGDVLSYASNVKEGSYIAFGCFQIDRDTTLQEHDIMKLIKENDFRVSTDNDGQGQNAWWNHPVHTRCPQHWGAAITSKDLIKLNGFDERFAFGYAYEDGYFVHQVEMLGLDIEITDMPFVVHQWHLHENPTEPFDKVLLSEINKKIYDELMQGTEFRAEHKITPDLCGI